jgi:predicted nucleotidyltransferase
MLLIFWAYVVRNASRWISIDFCFCRAPPLYSHHCSIWKFRPMRLTEQQRVVIKQTLLKHFGAASELRLFGSRVDDNARGGDIDLYIEPEIQQPDDIVEAKLNALVELHRQLGEQKIDLVINREQGVSLPIYQEAKETGVLL